jgi:LysM repeat protein
MKEIIPLKKDIIFKTRIKEITNISLDHDFKILDDMVEGVLYLSGTYKMTEASVVEEEFLHNIPFSIVISKRIKKDTIKIEIDDFKYEIEKDVMKVNVELELSCEEEETEVVKEDYDNVEEPVNTEEETELDNYINNYFQNDIVDIKEENKQVNIEENISNITNTIINNENKYYTYKVYIVREGDTVETICSKYNVLVEDLKGYNDLSNLNVGDKIIIPQINND